MTTAPWLGTSLGSATGTIVIAEDLDDARDVMSIMLTLVGYQVHAARNGLEAFEMALKYKPKAVISDLQMPAADGIALGKKLREAFGPELRLIALTGLGPQKALRQTREAGFDYYLLKPIDTNVLVPYIENPLHLE